MKLVKFSPKIVVEYLKKILGKGSHPLHEPSFIGNEIKYLKKAIKSSYVSSIGKYVSVFEEKIKKITGAKYAIATVNGTEALHISLIGVGVKKNDEVLVPALTFIGTVNAITYCGAEPHFIDSEISSLGVDSEKLEEYLKKIVIFVNGKTINRYTKRTISAVIPVHVFGHPCKIEEIVKISKKYNLAVVEDAAEALGSYYKKKHLGNFGNIGCLSFNGNKIITTGGGGAIITNNKNLAKKIRHLITTAKVKHAWEYEHNEIGYNLRMPNINAALGVAQLEKIDLFLKAKKILFKKYKEKISKIDGIELFEQRKEANSNYWLQTIILCKKKSMYKDEIIRLAYKDLLFLRPAWKLISTLRPYKNKQKMKLVGSRDIYKRVINIPSSQNLILK